MQTKDRIKELRRVPASEIQANPKNWRKHPQRQRAAMEAMLQKIGYADALLAREEDGQLLLIDGHLRSDISGDDMVPVLVLDVDEREADELLATLDPLSRLADTDEFQLESLLMSLSDDASLRSVLGHIGEEYGLDLSLDMSDFDLDPTEGEEEGDDFAMVQYVIQVPKYKSDPALERAVQELAEAFGVNYRVHGVK